MSEDQEMTFWNNCREAVKTVPVVNGKGHAFWKSEGTRFPKIRGLHAQYYNQPKEYNFDRHQYETEKIWQYDIKYKRRLKKSILFG